MSFTIRHPSLSYSVHVDTAEELKVVLKVLQPAIGRCTHRKDHTGTVGFDSLTSPTPPPESQEE